ncbi:MAG: DEAD/DEAH box helicase family protein, partial [Propionicimonas sp.]
MSTTAVMVPRPHQETAIAAVVSAFATADRTQLHMACGSGKTLVGIHVAQQLGSTRTAVICPSLALVEQTVRDWAPALPQGTRILIVCSDASTAAGQAEQAGADHDIRRAFHGQHRKVAHPTVVTTDPARAGQYLNLPGNILVVATYHSSSVLAEAVHDSEVPLDLVIADEAHHLAGKVSPLFRPVLQARVLAARKRLFMTATPITMNVSGLPGLDDVTDDPGDDLDGYDTDTGAWASMAD